MIAVSKKAGGPEIVEGDAEGGTAGVEEGNGCRQGDEAMGLDVEACGRGGFPSSPVAEIGEGQAKEVECSSCASS